jgi:hypothetical protein
MPDHVDNRADESRVPQLIRRNQELPGEAGGLRDDRNSVPHAAHDQHEKHQNER